MAFIAYYSAGSISVAPGSTIVTGAGTLWATPVVPGDTLEVGGLSVRIKDVPGDGTLTLAYPWPGGPLAGAAYIIAYTSPTRLSSTWLAERARELIERQRVLDAGVAIYSALTVGLNTPPAAPVTDDLYVVGTAPTGAWSGYAGHLAIWSGTAWLMTAPEEGMHAYDKSLGKIWARGVSAWTLYNGLSSGVIWRGAWSSAAAYVAGDAVSLAGTAYVAKASNTNSAPPSANWDTFVAGVAGAAGATPAMRFAFSTTTTDADPGAGTVRFNSATLSAVTLLFIDLLETGGADVTAWLAALDDSTNLNARGYLRFTSVATQTKWVEFAITGANVDASGYRKIAVGYVAGPGGFTNGEVVAVSFARSGDLGPAGAVAGAGAELARLRALVAKPPTLIMDFTREALWVDGAAGGSVSGNAAAFATLLSGSFSRASTAFYTGFDGLLKSAASGVPRIDYDPVTRERTGILMELSGTNLLLRSQEMGSSPWVSSLTVTADQIAAPDGTVTADMLTATGAATPNYYQAVTVTASTVYTFSAWVRLGTLSASDFKIAFRDDTAGVFIATDLVPSAVPTASGWTRIAYTLTTPVGCTALRVYPFRNSGSPTGTFYLWGAQLTAGSFVNSYIPTTSAAAARAADSLTVNTAPFGASQYGTLLAEFSAQAPATGNAVAVELAGSGVDNIQLCRNTGGNGAVLAVTATISQMATTAGMAWPSGGVARLAIAWAANDAAWAWMGALAGSSSTYTANAGLTLLRLPAGGMNGYVRRVAYWPRRLSNTELQALTA
ncbi:DUF2793 domain-containing protein [Xanthobacter sp. YC-JY1]|uniref:phage head spike fiber domain-containing protein n=1 Tax=Xanthobacter sp. YC-JY1 TaxID=2419844 RepID=UPI001F29C2E0|nr:DUF2793 domain-containing protein [Xanthobacter sp. YC-JY1]UJX46647.1 DUF2793 domain-containing protein [Xanthobacter sp. YC-JY1]